LRKVDNGSAHQGTKNPTIANGESTTSHVFNGELTISSLGRS
jgi:hypothetical protein